MQLNRANLNSVFTAVSTRFLRAYNAQRDDAWRRFVQVERMETDRLEMPFLEQITGMREWTDARVVQNLRAECLTVTSRRFELTYGIPRTAIEDDTYGVYGSLFESMAVQAANLPEDIITELIEKAAAAEWADGKKFSSADRKYGKATIANTTSAALSRDSFKAAYDAMTAYRGHGGTPLKVRPTVLVHGPALRWTVKALFDNPQAEQGTAGAVLPNDLHNIVDHVEMPGITGGKWLLLQDSAPYRPVVYFDRIAPDRLVRRDREEDANVFDQDQFLYGCRGRGGAAFVLPHLAYLGNPA